MRFLSEYAMLLGKTVSNMGNHAVASATRTDEVLGEEKQDISYGGGVHGSGPSVDVASESMDMEEHIRRSLDEEPKSKVTHSQADMDHDDDSDRKPAAVGKGKKRKTSLEEEEQEDESSYSASSEDDE